MKRQPVGNPLGALIRLRLDGQAILRFGLAAPGTVGHRRAPPDGDS